MVSTPDTSGNDGVQENSEQAQKLLEVLNGLSESVSFCAHGEVDSVLPGLSIDEIGDIGVPVSAADCKRIVKLAAQAPFGRGEETVVDTSVRKVWQLEPNQFQFENSQWDKAIGQILKRVQSEFGLKRKIKADLYKLLVYEKGGFFLPHRDTEKAEGMFATLVVCLPAKHSGGQLIVSHSDQSVEVDFGQHSKFATQYAAFYADCEHEVKKVESGYRVCVVYNLSISRTKSQPAAPELSTAIVAASSLLAEILGQDDQRDMMVLPLEHQYTEAGLTEDADEDDEPDDDWHDRFESAAFKKRASPAAKKLAAMMKETRASLAELEEEIDSEQIELELEEQSKLQLKGADRSRAEVLLHAAQKAGCHGYIALLTRWQTGYPDYRTMNHHSFGYGSRSRRNARDINEGNDDAEFEEVFDESMKLTHWHDLHGNRQVFNEMHINESVIISDTPASKWPFRQELHEATGNEGVSMERWYHQAVVVLWPSAKHFSVLASQGPENAIPELARVIESASDPADCSECQDFAREIIANWNSTRRSGFGYVERGLAAQFAGLLCKINDQELAQEFFKTVLPSDYFEIDGEALVKLAAIAGWKQVKDPLRELFESQTPKKRFSELNGLVQLMDTLCRNEASPLDTKRKTVCKSLTKAVLKTLGSWDKEKLCDWDTERNERRSVVFHLVCAFSAIGDGEALKQFMVSITGNEKRYDLNETLIPAVNRLQKVGQLASLDSGKTANRQPAKVNRKQNKTNRNEDNGTSTNRELLSFPQAPASIKLFGSTTRQLRTHCITELKQRTETQPQPPADWKRSAKLGCSCEDCKELARFLRSKTESVLRMPRRKQLRQHLHQRIDANKIDCTHTTERKGSPHVLVCTKTQASFERELRQYKLNLKSLAELEEANRR